MRRFVAIFIALFLFVFALAYWQAVLAFVDGLYHRPFRPLTDDQLRAEIDLAESVVSNLAEQSVALAGRPAAPGATQSLRESWAEVGKHSARLRQLRAEQSFRAGRLRYLLLAGFVTAFVVFFYFFRDAYLESIPGTRDRERMLASIARSRPPLTGPDRTIAGGVSDPGPAAPDPPGRGDPPQSPT